MKEISQKWRIKALDCLVISDCVQNIFMKVFRAHNNNNNYNKHDSGQNYGTSLTPTLANPTSVESEWIKDVLQLLVSVLSCPT